MPFVIPHDLGRELPERRQIALRFLAGHLHGIRFENRPAPACGSSSRQERPSASNRGCGSGTSRVERAASSQDRGCWGEDAVRALRVRRRSGGNHYRHADHGATHDRGAHATFGKLNRPLIVRQAGFEHMTGLTVRRLLCSRSPSSAVAGSRSGSARRRLGHHASDVRQLCVHGSWFSSSDHRVVLPSAIPRGRNPHRVRHARQRTTDRSSGLRYRGFRKFRLSAIALAPQFSKEHDPQDAYVGTCSMPRGESFR